MQAPGRNKSLTGLAGVSFRLGLVRMALLPVGDLPNYSGFSLDGIAPNPDGENSEV